MSIEIICSGCQKRYQVGDDRAGTRARCKVCGAILNIPGVAVTSSAQAPAEFIATPPVSFAPLPPPIAQSAYPNSGGAGLPYFRGTQPGGFAPPPVNAGSSTKMIVGIVVGILLLVFFLGGGVAFLVHVRNPAIFMTDAAIRNQLPGVWTLTHSAKTPTTGTMTYNADGTYQAHLIVNGRVSDFGGPYFVNRHFITITISQVRGRPAASPKQILFGPIRELSDTKLVLRTKYNEDEVYQRSAP